MADSPTGEDGGRATRGWLVVLALVGIFALALFLRAYWNLDVARTDGGYVLSAGSDPYYHKRAIDYIVENDWKVLTFDPLLNYPFGAYNPNPPLFHYTVAAGAYVFDPFTAGGMDEAVWASMIWSPAIWGALTILPVYLIGRDVFGRMTGVIAAFLLAVSTTHIDHTSLGAADHDSPLLFFALMCFWAYIRAVQRFRGDSNWVASWRRGADVSSGIGRFFRERRGGVAWALVAGLFLGAVGLMWKGFPYLIGVMFAYVIIQLVADHWRSKDSLGIWVATLVTFLVGTLILVPFYAQSNVLGFLRPVWFLIGALAIFGLVMVPTRDLPTLLVLPAFAVIAIVAAIAAYFVLPDVARSLLYATVYFKQSTLYQTIAEAHPADFNTMVFSIGPVTFFLAFAGAILLVLRLHRTYGEAALRLALAVGVLLVAWIVHALLGLMDGALVEYVQQLVFASGVVGALAIFLTTDVPQARAYAFMFVWAVIAVYMAQSAVRFLFNAAPILAILAAWTVALVIEWLDFAAIRRNMAAGARRAIGTWHVVGAVLIALLVVVPNVFLAVDAGAPPQEEDIIVRANLIDYLDTHRESHSLTRAELEAEPTGTLSFVPLEEGEDREGLWEMWLVERGAQKGLAPEDLDEATRKDLARWGGAATFVNKRMGAFGQGFLPDYWNEGLTNLSKLDDYGPSARTSANRPGFVSWWDYGHWAIAVGKHPSVADNFQNGYEYAANFLLSENETHAVQLMSARALPLLPRERGVELVGAAGVNDSAAAYDALLRWEYVPDLTLDEAVALEASVTEATKGLTARDGSRPYPDGVRIRYFATDVRMLPYDLPGNGFIEQSSIFYAPVVLAKRTPEDYVQLLIQGTEPNRARSDGLYTEDEFENTIRQVTRYPNFRALGQSYTYKQPFFDSMYYRGFVGSPASAFNQQTGQEGVDGGVLNDALRFPQPGYGLAHWRLIEHDDELRILEYYPGATLAGKVEEDGAAVAGATVVAYDDAGRLLHPKLSEGLRDLVKPEDLNVAHASARTAEDGTFELTLPFNLDGGAVTVVVSGADGAELGRKSYQVTRADANARRAMTDTIAIEKGNVEGRVYYDANGDNAFTDGTDEPLAAATVTVAGRNVTTNADGTWRLDGVSPGTRSVDVDAGDDYAVASGSAQVTVKPGETTPHDVAMTLRTVTLTGTVTYDADGSGDAGAGDKAAPAVSLQIAPAAGNTGKAPARTPFTNANGTYSVALAPGTWTVTANYTVDGGDTYQAVVTVDVPRASVSRVKELDVLLVRKA